MRVLTLMMAVGCASTAGEPIEPTTPVSSPGALPALTRASIVHRPATSLESAALARVNHYRMLAGVERIGIEPSLGAGCVEHAQYLFKNRGHAALDHLRVHGQDPTLPGASARGAACGKAAVIDQVARDAGDAIEAWMGTLYHRAPILAPYVDRIGIGAAGPTHAQAVVMAFGVRPADPARERWPVAFPVDGQTRVPVDFVREVPNPIPGNGEGGGYPFTLQFPPTDAVTGVQATLVDEDGAVVPIYVSSPQRPASPHHAQRGLIGVIPQKPLRAARRYTVTVRARWKGKPGTWSSTFTTMPRIVVDARDRDALFGALDKPASVRGTVVRSGRVDDATAYMLLASPDGVTVDVRVPTGDRIPTGVNVEVQGTPMLYGSSTIRIKALRVVTP